MQQNFASCFNRVSAALAGVALTLVVAGCAGSGASRSSGSATDLYARGSMAYQQGRLEQAATDLRAATAADPGMATAHETLGDVLEQQQKYAEAADEYSTVIRLDPNSAPGYRKLGMVQQSMQRTPEAMSSLERAVQLAPADSKNVMALGLAYLSAGEIDEAVAYLRRATDLAPADGKAWANLAVAFDAEAHYPDAENAYRMAIGLGGTPSSTLMNLATNLLVQKKAADADTLLKDLVMRDDSAPARTLHGDSLRMLNRGSEADAEYRAALRLDPRDYGAMNGLAAVKIHQYQASKKTDDQARKEAVNLWRQSLAIRTPQPQVETLVRSYAR